MKDILNVLLSSYTQHARTCSPSGSSHMNRVPSFEGSPFLRQRKSRSVIIPGVGPVKLRHGSSHSHSQYSSGVGLPNFDPDRIPDDLMSLEDFLAESEKTPNRVCSAILSLCL